MLKISDFIRATKTDVDVGQWEHGHIKPSVFPLSKAKRKHFKFGPEYRWCLIRFNALEQSCRVLILYNKNKQICRSTFAVDVDNDIAVLCTHEYHADHPGWHCHVSHKELDKIEPGVFRSGQRRWPNPKAVHSKVEFGVTDASILTHVAARYRFEAQGEML